MMNGIKVLYVEDEPNLAKLVVDTLNARGLVVNHIDHGLKVMQALDHDLPDVCVLDVMLPGKDGFQLGKEIRLLHPSLPILFLTAKSTTEDVLEGFNTGGNDYMRKPFSVDELIARIQNLSKWSMQNRQDPPLDWSIGRFQLYPLKQELRIDQEIIPLTHRENELLKMLIAKKSQNIQRQEILSTIWGDDSFFNSRNLDVYISKIRGYLRHDPEVQLLTLKGVGYRLIG